MCFGFYIGYGLAFDRTQRFLCCSRAPLLLGMEISSFQRSNAQEEFKNDKEKFRGKACRGVEQAECMKICFQLVWFLLQKLVLFS